MIWKISTVALIIVVILLATCNGCKEGGGTIVKSDTVTIVKHDTVPFSTVVYVPQPYAVKEPVPVYVEGKEVTREVDTSAILKDYYSNRFYSDTQRLDRAEIVINDQISENRIKQRQVSGNIVHDSIITTITNTVELPKKNEVWLGFVAQNNAFGGEASFLQKKGWGFEGAVLKPFDGRPLIYQATVKKQLWK